MKAMGWAVVKSNNEISSVLEFETFDVLGSSIAVTSVDEICDKFELWSKGNSTRSIYFSDVHSMVLGYDNPDMKQALADADIVCPDGHPVAWVGRFFYRLPARRTCGPDTMLAVCSRSPKSGLKHFFYGGAPGVADELAREMSCRFPGIEIVGTDSPPMRPLTEAEDQAAVEEIIRSGADVVWVGLGAPKQEIWIMNHKARLPGMILAGVGAAFDFHTGRIQRAPVWMRNTGLEWFYRACSEPKRLGARYAKVVPRFVNLIVKQMFSEVRA